MKDPCTYHCLLEFYSTYTLSRESARVSWFIPITASSSVRISRRPGNSICQRGMCADDDGCPRLHKKWSCPSLHSGIPSRTSLYLRQNNCTVVRRYIPSIALSKFHTYSLYIPSKRNASQSGTFAMADIFDLLFDGANIDAFEALFLPFLLTAYLWLRFAYLWLRKR